MKERCRSSSISRAGDSNWPEPTTSTRAAIFTACRNAAAGIATKFGNHSFRATGITAYLENGSTFEKALANHASTRATQLYDRRRDEVSLDEVERIAT
jgi:integrase